MAKIEESSSFPEKHTMNPLWIAAATLTPLGLVLFIGNRLFKQALTKEGLCPVCQGAGGLCKTCNGLGMIGETTPDDKDAPNQ
ncbi:hypothetical protein [Leptothoe kymatousa]|uniref:Uncharacterized protein n=1 Tax=Leptothoe kymatousa TAU-MAC 1615 TaxID=2364775 RepID=A0ABS5Y1K0_9CYAN|nr:hypothetical protein [Leptothoe kymatousa]MBT9311681.1 hypothetical protein [Leptothoe kymatousa TAU-MAC 1615]